MNKLGIAAATVVALAGAAGAQVSPPVPAANQPSTGQPPAYTVDGIALGAKLKRDSAMYREYKCSPSEQFAGFTWCQRSRRDSDKHGSFDVIYSILHAKDGTVVYVNRFQHPAFFEANERDRDIQNYTRKFGGATPQIAKMPRRSGGADGALASWGEVELVPLDDDSMKVVVQGKSPRKGLLIDFIGNFQGSAQEGLPVYRITGGAGFVWAGTFDQKGRGALRFAAVDASALPGAAAPSVALQSLPPAATERVAPEPVAPPPAEPEAPPQLAQPAAPPPVQPAAPPLSTLAAPPRAAKPIDQPPAAERFVPPLAAAPVAEPPEPLSTPAAPPRAVEPPAAPPPAKLAVRPPIAAQDAERPPAASPAEFAAAVKAQRDAEARIAQLQGELSEAVQAKTDAEQGRARAEAAARQARSEAEIARTEYEAARKDANAANSEIDQIMAGGMPASFVNRAIFIGVSAAAVLVFIILGIAKITMWLLAKEEPQIDQDELLDQMAKSLGVEEPLAVEEPPPPPPPLPPLLTAAPTEGGGDPPATEMAQQDQMRASANGDGRSIASSEASDVTALAPTGETNGDAGKSIVPAIPSDGEAEQVKPAQAATASHPENANQS